MKPIFLFMLLTLCISTKGYAKQIVYTTEDSIQIEALLKESASLPKGTNKILFFAEKFIGTPYGGASLEHSGEERLVVNLKKFDCLTLVETVAALTLADRTEKKNFREFCKYLRKFRYRNGIINGYLSRLHYFSSWIGSNEKQMLVHEVNIGEKGRFNPFTAHQQLNINYMSRHRNEYSALRLNDSLAKGIREEELRLSGREIKYIPADKLSGGKNELSSIKEGDIIAIVTRRAGLDVSHLGFAVWVDNRVHLLNASTLHKKVVLEKKTLGNYMSTQRNQIGVRIIRIQQE